MAKKKVREVNKKEQEELEAFKADLLAVEKKHGRKLIPLMNYSDQGLYPSLGVQKVQEEKKEVEKK